jgi:hypothetical protein
LLLYLWVVLPFVWRFIRPEVRPFTSCAQTTGGKSETQGAEGKTTGVQGETQGAEGETTGVKGEIQGAKGETTGVKGETQGAKGETTGVKGETPLGVSLHIRSPIFILETFRERQIEHSENIR